MVNKDMREPESPHQGRALSFFKSSDLFNHPLTKLVAVKHGDSRW